MNAPAHRPRPKTEAAVKDIAEAAFPSHGVVASVWTTPPERKIDPRVIYAFAGIVVLLLLAIALGIWFG